MTYRRNVPLLHTSRYVIGLSFTRPSPALVLQATNTGVRRPGYEASFHHLQSLIMRGRSGPGAGRQKVDIQGVSIHKATSILLAV